MTARLALAVFSTFFVAIACALPTMATLDLDDPIAGERAGRADAAKAISEGDLKILARGGGMRPVGVAPPAPRHDRLTGLPIVTYGAGCVIDPYFEGYLRGFNLRMREYVASDDS